MAFVPSTVIEVEITGLKFNIDYIDKRVTEALKKMTNECLVIASSKFESEEDIQKQSEKMINDCHNFIDKVLGTNAFDKIMEGKEHDVFYIMEVSEYIMGEIAEAKEKRLSRYLNLKN